MIKFESCFGPDFHDFIKYKRSLGFGYVRRDYILRRFDRFLVAAGAKRKHDLEQAALDWLASQPQRKPQTVAGDMAAARQLLAFLHRRDPRRYPAPNLPPNPRAQKFKPYIFSEEEVLHLVDLAKGLGPPEYRCALYPALILLLYGTGLRFGEALRLRMRDVDLGNRVMWIVECKGRTRWVPFHASLSAPLEQYLRFRRWLTVPAPDDGFFAGLNGRNLSIFTAGGAIRSLFCDAGLKPRSGRSGPRPTDFRHTFAVHRLTQWYREGVDLHARLPWLSAYLGHVNLLGTEKYLTATPELLSIASFRFRDHVLGEEEEE